MIFSIVPNIPLTSSSSAGAFRSLLTWSSTPGVTSKRDQLAGDESAGGWAGAAALEGEENRGIWVAGGGGGGGGIEGSREGLLNKRFSR